MIRKEHLFHVWIMLTIMWKIAEGCSSITFMLLICVLLSVCYIICIMCLNAFCCCLCTIMLYVSVCVCVFVYLAASTVAMWRPLRDPWKACRRRVQSDLSHDPLLPSLSIHNGVLIWTAHTRIYKKRSHVLFTHTHKTHTFFVSKCSVLWIWRLINVWHAVFYNHHHVSSPCIPPRLVWL